MSKILLFSDLHLHNWTYGATQERGWNSRLLVQKKFLEDLREVVIKEQVDHVFFLGDLFHEHGVLRADVIEVAYNGLKGIAQCVSGKCVALVGNHDFLTRNGGIHSLTFIEGTGWDIAFPEYTFDNFRFMSFIPDKKLFYDMLRMNNSYEFGFFHQGVLGVPMASGFELPDEILRTTELPPETLCFAGHYHRRQKVSDNLIIVGSPMQHTWGDSGDERGFIILNTETREYEFRNYNGPKFISRECDAVSSFDLTDIQNNYIRLYGDVPLLHLEGTRDLVMDNGARSCEIVPKVKAEPDFQTKETFSVTDAIKLYEKEALLSDKEIEVGEQLRNGGYRGNKKLIH